MRRFRPLAIILSLVLMLTAVAASPYACQGNRMDMPTAAHHEAMPDMGMAAMKDCPSMKKAAETGKAKHMEADCALACYGLATSVMFEPLPLFSQTPHRLDSPVMAASQPTLGHILGVPTPPPNFA
ncbi:MAG TPA: hypothetical protein VHP58_01440 [Alphaproteobacteria bacterium]|nr:hypothetical protein [Alphaproteobacteria bacterium]